MSKPKFAHNVFQTANHGAMRDWYCTVLDAHVVYEDATLTFLTFDDEHHRVRYCTPRSSSRPRRLPPPPCTTRPTPSTASTRCWSGT
jgi:hypothetical protein